MEGLTLEKLRAGIATLEDVSRMRWVREVPARVFFHASHLVREPVRIPHPRARDWELYLLPPEMYENLKAELAAAGFEERPLQEFLGL